MKLSRRGAIGVLVSAATAFSLRMNSQSTLEAGNIHGSSDAQAHGGRLLTFPFPDGATANPLFSVRVRTAGGAWQEVKPYSMRVSKVERGRTTQQDVSAAFFDFTGAVDISVTYLGEQIRDVRLRPASLNLAFELRGNMIQFSLNEARNLSIEVNGDIYHNLHLFAGVPELAPPKEGTSNVMYFGPGVHSLTAQQGRLASGQTVYLSGGAVVRGSFLMEKVENVRILGRGILDQTGESIKVRHSKNIEIEGIVTAGNIQIGQSENISIWNTKSVRAGQWGDGIDVFCCRNVTIENAFLRTSDDCIAIYGHRWDYDGNVEGVKVSKCVLWADIAHPILVGTHGNTENPNELTNIRFSDIDILDQHEEQIDYQGCMSLNAGDGNLIRDVIFDNIRIENFRLGQLVNLRVFYNKTYNTSPGRGIEDVTFRDVTYNGTHANLSIIAGYDETRKVKNIIFENLKINGEVISDDMPAKPKWYKTGDFADIFVGEHVEDLKFNKTATASPKSG